MNRALKAGFLIIGSAAACCARAGAADVLKQDWVFRYNGSGYTGVESHAVALDDAGNFYLGGQYGSPGTIPGNYVEARASDDAYLWSYKNITGIVYPQDQFTRGLAPDRLGNIYSVGSVVTSDAGRNLFLQKFNRADGALLWTKQVDGPANSNDEGYGVAFDRAGDILVAGALHWVGRGMDAWVGKYDPAGNRLWELVLDGGANADDAAYGVCVDTLSRVYAVGSFSVTGAGKQIWVGKFSPDGALLAQNVYGAGDDDTASACAVNDDGTLFVAGAVTDPAALSTQTVRTHAWLRAYRTAADPELTELATVVDELNWGRTNGLAAARLSSGVQAVFMVGETMGAAATDAQITRWLFNPGANTWQNKREAVFDGSAHLADAAYGAAVDAQGNLVAAGFETVTDSTGTAVRAAWYRQYDPWVLAVSTTAYRSSGDADGTDGFSALYLDADKELLYAAGNEYTHSFSYEANLQAFDTVSGNRLDYWKSNMPGWERPAAMQRDAAGDFYLAGNHPATQWKIRTTASGKFDGMAWRNTYNPFPGTYGENTNGVVLLPDRTFVTTGLQERTDSNFDIVVRKWDTKTCDAAPAESFCLPAILWTEYVTSPGEYGEAGQAAAADTDGNVYIAGYIFNAAQGNNIWLAKYSPSGVRLWTREIDGAAYGGDIAYGIAFNPVNGGLYATGQKAVTGHEVDIWLARINKDDGTTSWETLWNGPGSRSDVGRAITFDKDGNPFLAGYSSRINASGKIVKDGVLVKFGPDGNLIEAYVFSLPGASEVWVQGLQVDAQGKVYAAGAMSVLTRSNPDGWVAKFSFEPVVLPPAPEPGPPCALYSYPNPVNPDIKPATLHWELPWDAAVKLTLYDQLGQTVKTWDYPLGTAGGRKGINSAPWDGSNSSGGKVRQGMYYLKMSAEPIGCDKTARIGIKR